MTDAQAAGGNGISLTRRQLLQSGAAAGGAAVVGPPAFRGIGIAAAQDGSTFTAVGAGLASPGLAAGAVTTDLLNSAGDWLSGESDGEETDASYISGEAFHDFRRFHNSTIRELGLHDTIIDYVIKGHCGAFSEAKMAAIDAINATETKSKVKEEGRKAAKKFVADIQESLVRCGNSAMDTLQSYMQNAAAQGVVGGVFTYDDQEISTTNRGAPYIGTWNDDSVELLDGREVEFRYYQPGSSSGSHWGFDSGTAVVAPINATSFVDIHYGESASVSGTQVDHVVANVCAQKDDEAMPVLPIDGAWNGTPSSVPNDYRHGTTLQDVWDQLMAAWNDTLKPNIETWVDEAYRQVNVGEIEPAELMTACEMSRNIAENNPNHLATASLRMQSVDYDTNSTATIETTTHAGRTVTASGVLVATDASVTVQEGQTKDPQNDNFDWILNYSTDSVAVEADDLLHQSETDGGLVYWSATPKVDDINRWTGDSYVIQIETGDGETAQLSPSDFEPVDGESWSYQTDISGLVTDSITTIESVTVYSSKSVTANIFLQREFTVTKLEGTSELNYDENDRRPHTTTNYMTDDEWEEREQQVNDVAESLPDEDGGGGGGLGGLFGDGGLLDFGGDWKKWAIIGGGGLLLYGFVTGS